MHILVSNDDGYHAPGIQVLTQALRKIAKVSVVAPLRDLSGCSQSLTLERPMRKRTFKIESSDAGTANEVIAIDGTPTDCVHLAMTGLLDSTPDIVISGINHGANMGDDVLYSGTVAAAMEGRYARKASIAVSIPVFKPKYFETAAKVIADLVEHIDNFPIHHETVLNINVPDIPYEQLKGIKVTRLGKRARPKELVKEIDPRGHEVYWIGPPGEGVDAGEGTDFSAVKNGFVSVTPLQINLTKNEELQPLDSFFSKGLAFAEDSVLAKQSGEGQE